jgi:hypothetical protein
LFYEATVTHRHHRLVRWEFIIDGKQVVLSYGTLFLMKTKSSRLPSNHPLPLDGAQTATAIFAAIRRNNPRKSKNVVRTAKVIFEIK